MPIFANYQIDMICSIFFFSFFFLTRIFVCQAGLPCFFSSSEICLGVAVYTFLLSLKVNHRLHILGYDLPTSASAHNWLDLYLSSCSSCQMIIRCWIESQNWRSALWVPNVELLVGVHLSVNSRIIFCSC